MTLPLIVGTAPGFSWILFRGAKLCWSKWALQSLAPGPGLQPGFRQQNRIHFLLNISLRGNLNRFILLPQDFKLHCGIFGLNSEIKFLHIFKLYMIPESLDFESLLSCIPPVLNPSFPIYLQSWITPFLFTSSPEFLLSYISPFLLWTFVWK